MPETPEEYTKRQQQRFARQLQKLTGRKYTECLREVQSSWDDQISTPNSQE